MVKSLKYKHRWLKQFVYEDLGRKGDITSKTVVPNKKVNAKVFVQEDCILAGADEAKNVFEYFKIKVSQKYQDGCELKKNNVIFYLEGKAHSILAAERLALNFLMKMSGIATQTANILKKCRRVNKNFTLAATRKTTPGFRKFEKKAVLLGGGMAHRRGLYDGILIKDNHLKLIDSIEDAIRKAKRKYGRVEIEVESLSDAIKAVSAGADIILLDNLSPRDVKLISQSVRKVRSDVKIEVSGGITAKNIIKYARYADIISVGALTHSPKAVSFSLEIL
jgi:nicotinate-nucleotide pyrophosphorylase (carboxylating)